MKRIFKFLAVLLAMVLVAGSVPARSVSAASTVSVKAPKKAIFVGGCTGTKASGKKANYKSTLKVKSLLTGFDADNMTLKLTSSDKKIASVSNKTYKVKAVAPGTATITVKVYKKTDKKTPIVTSSFEVTVKKNASDADLTYKGITDGATYTVGQKLTVQLPKGTDTDKRRLTSANDNAAV
ncbi:MAG: Ig-like domain-containing protein, partial [Synergistes sp.]|nr:Ig-like domain-containing protein [Synergistes sp.]